MANEEFGEGFHFAMMVMVSLGKKVDVDETVAFLRELMKGNVTLQPSPQDAIKAIEKEFNKRLPDNLKQSVHRMLSGKHRTEGDENARRRARMVLEYMGAGSE